MKKIISLALALIVTAFCVVPAYATAENKYEGEAITILEEPSGEKKILADPSVSEISMVKQLLEMKLNKEVDTVVAIQRDVEYISEDLRIDVTYYVDGETAERLSKNADMTARDLGGSAGGISSVLYQRQGESGTWYDTIKGLLYGLFTYNGSSVLCTDYDVWQVEYPKPVSTWRNSLKQSVPTYTSGSSSTLKSVFKYSQGNYRSSKTTVKVICTNTGLVTITTDTQQFK